MSWAGLGRLPVLKVMAIVKILQAAFRSDQQDYLHIADSTSPPVLMSAGAQLCVA